MEHESRAPHGDLALAKQSSEGEQATIQPADTREVEIQFDAGIFLRFALGCIAVLAALGLLAAYLGYAREEGLPRLILRGFLLDDHAVILLAARVDGAPRVPRDVELIRLTLALGTGLQLRTIGGLALVAIQMPTVDRRWIANRQGSGLLAV